MKIILFVAREIQYFELEIFSFNSHVCYLTRGFIASNRAFNLPTRAFNLATCAFSLRNRRFELVTLGFELTTRRFELVTRIHELVTRNSIKVYYVSIINYTFKNFTIRTNALYSNKLFCTHVIILCAYK